uniref:Large ribosomal subunit protein bL32c n=1 Tax=Leptochilus hemionitideus TaxID=493391 RepID=A0A3G5CV94_9MONI|nr:ribosomal protein L32 [Leptochilus hemionitideus]AYW16827.1 ribosomal protein L32 [Leptochilus hemionitideus]
MAVPKKRTSSSKRKIRNRTWKAGPVKVASVAFSLAQSVLTGRSTSFYYVTEKVTEERDSSYLNRR